MQLDILIKGGTVVDGTGAPRFRADVGVRDDRIVAVGNLEGAVAGRVIDAGGKCVAPGFIDVHVHHEIAAVGGIDQHAQLVQGVTTELMAPDGFGWAPLRGWSAREMRSYLRVFNPPLPDGEWATVKEFLSLFHGKISTNQVPQVPHCAVRLDVMGWAERTATDEEIIRMGDAVREWLDAGAVSLCLGLEYMPSASADTRELVELSKIVAERGGIYVAHQRGYGPKIARGTRETFRIMKEANIPVHISHLSLLHGVAEELALGDSDGVDYSFEAYPYAAGCTHLLYVLPNWAQAGGTDAVLARLRAPEVRARLKPDLEEALKKRGQLVFANVQNAPEMEGRSFVQVLEESGKSLADFVCDMLIRNELQVLMIFHWEGSDHEPVFRRTIQHPRMMVASDGVYKGGKPHPRGFGTFPRVLGVLCREQGAVSLETAVRKMSGFPAERFRIRERGLIREGLFADLVVFGPDTVADRATYEQARQAPVGIDQVIVNGVVSVSCGAPTGALAGRVV